MRKIIIYTTIGVIRLIGKSRPDLEKRNWHYYETKTGAVVHIRKEHMIAVVDADLNNKNLAYDFKRNVDKRRNI